MQEARMVSGSDVDQLIVEFRYAAGVADEHAEHGCGKAAFAAGYASAMVTVLELLGVAEDDVFGPDSDTSVTVRVENMGPPLTLADIDATNLDALVASLTGNTGEDTQK